jgi:hypothetical protein
MALRMHSSQELRRVEKEYLGFLASDSVRSKPTSLMKALVDFL